MTKNYDIIHSIIFPPRYVLLHSPKLILFEFHRNLLACPKIDEILKEFRISVSTSEFLQYYPLPQQSSAISTTFYCCNTYNGL